MKIKIQKVSGSVLLVMLLITVVILGLFFFGGNSGSPTGGRRYFYVRTCTDRRTDLLDVYFACYYYTYHNIRCYLPVWS